MCMCIHPCTDVYLYVYVCVHFARCVVITFSRLGPNREWLPIVSLLAYVYVYVYICVLCSVLCGYYVQ